MDSPDATLGTLPAQAAVPDEPPADERRPSRRKKALLLFLLLVLLLLTLLTVWYLLFRKPITELPNPAASVPMPTYQGALYDLSAPMGVAVTPDGARIVVTQTGTTQDTVMIDRMGNTLGVLRPPASLIPQPEQLFVAFDPVTSQYWTTDRYNAAVVVYDASGGFVKIFDQGRALAGWQPLGISFDKQGNAYIADVSNGARASVIDVFGPDGKLLRTFGGSDSLDSPNGIAVADDGTVYVADSGNGRLQVFDASGQRIGMIDRGVADGNLGMPRGLAFDDQGHMVVVDSTASRVQAYAPLVTGETGPRYINYFGEAGSADGDFSYPNGLATDGRGRVYVADWGNDRLEIWSY